MEPSEINRQLTVKLEEKYEEVEKWEEEDEVRVEVIFGEEGDEMDYQTEIPDTQDEEVSLIMPLETAHFRSIAQLGDINLKTCKFAPKQVDELADLLAAIDKVFDQDLCI